MSRTHFTLAALTAALLAGCATQPAPYSSGGMECLRAAEGRTVQAGNTVAYQPPRCIEWSTGATREQREAWERRHGTRPEARQ